MSCCASDAGYSECSDQAPISFAQWQFILSKLTRDEAIKQLSSNSNPHRRPITRHCSSRSRKQERHSLPRNQVFSNTIVDSFLVSSSNITQSSIDTQRRISSPNRRYISSFKTLVNSTSSKHQQRLSYVNDSVIILKLSKENATQNTGSSLQLSRKQSALSMATTTTSPPQQPPSSSSRWSPILKVAEQKRRAVPNDSSVTSAANTDIVTSSNLPYTMATSTTSHPSSNPSLFAYRSTLTAGSTVRQRALAETNTNSLFITTERLKSNISSAMRPARQPLTAVATATTTAATTTISSASISSQQPQRNTSQSTRPRLQQDKLTNSKDLYEYPDPFTNCPPDILSKLAQLTKLQLETVEWEKKRRFTTKTKPKTNGTTHGKDSP